MSSHVRQHKSPYFYVRKGAGFVLLENHVETGTRYKTEAEAKRAVLALNDAWRAKGAKSNPRKTDQAAVREEVIRLISTPPRYGAGVPLDTFAESLRRGTALSAQEIEWMLEEAEERLDTANYELKNDRIREHKADNREDRDHYRMLVKAIKKLTPTRVNNPRIRSR
jgi:hypothetical protein